MFLGQRADHLQKHLPDVTRRSFQKMDTGNGQSLLTEFSMLASQAKAAGAGFQTFDTGPTITVNSTLISAGPGRSGKVAHLALPPHPIS
jgi:hypothetical protein